MLDQNHAETVLDWYQGLELRALEFKRYVPPQGQNNKTWSPLLAEVIVEASALLDSVFRRISQATNQIGKHKIKRAKLRLPHFCRLYKTKYDLEDRKVILRTSPPEYRTPFSNWSEHRSPDWWTTHISLKHDRLKNIQQATWGKAIDALAGALLVIGVLPQFTLAMMRRDWLDFRMYPEGLLEHARKGFKQQDAVSLHTPLFIAILGGDPLPTNIQDFRPVKYGASSRLIAQFGRL